MENRLVSSLKELMFSFGIDMESMNVTVAEKPNRSIADLLENIFFLKTDEEIYQETICIKNAVFEKMYGIDFCAFEKLTKICWEEMFNACFLKHECFEHAELKVIDPWFHIITSSAIYNGSTELIGRNHAFLFKYSHTGQEFISINDTLYIYGEAKIVADRMFDFKRTTSHLRLIQPTIIIDERLLPELVQQKEWSEMVQILYTLYHLSSHDGMIHSIFMETDKTIRETAQRHPIMKGFTERHYFFYDMYEMNYARMMRAIFAIGCEHNPLLYTELKDLWTRVHELSSEWPFVLQEYVRFIATERTARLIVMPVGLFTVDRYLSGVAFEDSDEVPLMKIEDHFLYDIIHSFPEKEAIVYTNATAGDMREVPYRDMTMFMMNRYTRTG